MEHKGALLDQLRIDRTQTPRQQGGGTRRRWLLGLGAAVMIVAAAGVWVFASARDGIAVHTVVAKALATRDGGGLSTFVSSY